MSLCSLINYMSDEQPLVISKNGLVLHKQHMRLIKQGVPLQLSSPEERDLESEDENSMSLELSLTTRTAL